MGTKDLIHYIRMFEISYTNFEIRVEHDDGLVVWPERYSREVLDQIRLAQGNRIYETQYLNRPRATEDIVFKREYVKIHHSLDEFPIDLTYKTIVDLAGWGDSKGTARNVVLTGARSKDNHIWIARLDVGRYNPTDVINIFKAHSRQFKSRICIEEIQYQRAIAHFSRQEMERTGEWFSQERLPFDGRKGAKDLRIRALEPIITNGALHILLSMHELLEELEFYPYSRTVDTLDCLGYLHKVAKPSISTPVQAIKDPFSMEEIELELKRKRGNQYPFDVQMPFCGVRYGRN